MSLVAVKTPVLQCKEGMERTDIIRLKKGEEVKRTKRAGYSVEYIVSFERLSVGVCVCVLNPYWLHLGANVSRTEAEMPGRRSRSSVHSLFALKLTLLEPVLTN